MSAAVTDAAAQLVALVREDENSHGGLLSVATMRAANELDRLLRVDGLAAVTGQPGDVHNLQEDGFNGGGGYQTPTTEECAGLFAAPVRWL